MKSKFNSGLIVGFLFFFSYTNAQINPEGFVFKIRPHYLFMGETFNFERYFIQTETRLGGHHGIGLNVDFLGTDALLAMKDSKLSSWGAGVNYRFVFKKDYFVNSFYINSALLLRNYDIEHQDVQLGTGKVNTYGLNTFLNFGHQWYLFKNHLQIAAGIGVDANFMFNNNVKFGTTSKTISELDINEEAPVFPIAPDLDITIGWRF